MSAATLPAVEVDKLRTQIRADIDAITTVQELTVEFDTGPDGRRDQRHYTAPCLLAQVERDLVGVKGVADTFSPRSVAPVTIDALDLFALIDACTRGVAGADRSTRLHTWAAAASSAAAAAVIDDAPRASSMRSTVQNLLDPKLRHRLRGQACPRCRAEKIWHREDQAAGEHHTRPALEVDRDLGVCTCLHCGAEWGIDLWEHLGAVLRQQREETLAAEGWNPTVEARTADEAGPQRGGRALRPLGSVAVSLPTFERPDDRGVRQYLHPGDLTPRDAHAAVLAAVPTHAPDLSRTDPALIQCTARVAHPDPRPPYRIRRRCPSLLEIDGGCPNAEAHVWEPGIETDTDTDADDDPATNEA